MKRKKRKKTPEERAAEKARHEDLTRRLAAAIEHYRARAEERRRLGGQTLDESTVSLPTRKPWSKMGREERAAERARWKDLDRRLLAAIERYGGGQAEA